MSYPGPPGASSNPSHPSLPPRPPASKAPAGFKPAFSPATSSYSAPATSYAAPSASSYPTAPPGYGSSQYGAPAAANPSSFSYSQPPSGGRGSSFGRGGAFGRGGSVGRGGSTNYQAPASYNYSQHGYPQQQQQPQQQQPYYGATGADYLTPPQVRNPFPAPSANTSDYDPEAAAQIAQWQSAYMPKDADPNKGSGASRFTNGVMAASVMGTASSADPSGTIGPAEPSAASAAADHGESDKKKATVYREGGGKKWSDETLLEWDPSHLRLFVGNLAGEVTDESLLKAFARWGSVQRAKVIRDKRTSKSKGYGFVSFSDPDDFFQAAKEMNGKYIQSHPVVVHKAKTEIKPQAAKDDRHNRGKNNKKGGGGRNKSGSGGRAGSVGYEAHLGPSGGGVTKPGQRTKGGLKLLG